MPRITTTLPSLISLEGVSLARPSAGRNHIAFRVYFSVSPRSRVGRRGIRNVAEAETPDAGATAAAAAAAAATNTPTCSRHVQTVRLLCQEETTLRRPSSPLQVRVRLDFTSKQHSSSSSGADINSPFLSQETRHSYRTSVVAVLPATKSVRAARSLLLL